MFNKLQVQIKTFLLESSYMFIVLAFPPKRLFFTMQPNIPTVFTGPGKLVKLNVVGITDFEFGRKWRSISAIILFK